MMKKLLFIALLVCIFTTGCFKRDSMEDINIITTFYPIEYVTSTLYGEHSVVNSIYPDDTNVYEYKLNNKQLKDYSKQDLFIYLGLTSDRETAVDLLNKNNEILIIDGTYGMEVKYGIEELWLNPSNLLMISQNIKNGLQEYINSAYLNKEIDENYGELKVALSELDAEFKLTAENSKDKTNSKSNHYIFMLENEEESGVIKNIRQNTSVNILTFRNITNITDEERNNREDYIKIMNENLELLKKETYNK